MNSYFYKEPNNPEQCCLLVADRVPLILALHAIRTKKFGCLNNRNFSSLEDVFRRLLLLHLPLEQDLEGQPGQEEEEFGQGDQREAAQHGQPAPDRAWFQLD